MKHTLPVVLGVVMLGAAGLVVSQQFGSFQGGALRGDLGPMYPSSSSESPAPPTTAPPASASSSVADSYCCAAAGSTCVLSNGSNCNVLSPTWATLTECTNAGICAPAQSSSSAAACPAGQQEYFMCNDASGNPINKCCDPKNMAACTNPPECVTPSSASSSLACSDKTLPPAPVSGFGYDSASATKAMNYAKQDAQNNCQKTSTPADPKCESGCTGSDTKTFVLDSQDCPSKRVDYVNPNTGISGKYYVCTLQGTCMMSRTCKK